MIEGAFIKGSYGFPHMRKQEEVKCDDNVRMVMGTVNVVELSLEGVEETIVATSACSKSVYFFEFFLN